MPSRLDLIDLSGTFYELGVKHGQKDSEKIRHFLKDGVARLDTFHGSGVEFSQFEEQLRLYGDMIKQETPNLFQEIRGLSEGAGIPMEQAVLLQTRREMGGYTRFSTVGDCTTFARTRGKPVLGQTVDLAGDMDEHVTVLRIQEGENRYRSLLLSFSGLIGYLGVNDQGLAVGLNLVLAGDWRPGVPPYLAIRHVLDTCKSVDEAIARFSALDLASSRCFVVCDHSNAAFVEVVENRVSVHRSHEVVHTNHYLSPEFVAHDELNIFAQNGSKKRMEACQSWLDANPSECSLEDYFEMFSQKPIRVVGVGDRSVEKTVASVVLDPVNGALHVREGDPYMTTTKSFQMTGW